MLLKSRTVDVSVIMPIYRTKEKFLRKAVLSVLGQSLKNFEFIILNDSPDDVRLRNIIGEFCDERIKYFENDANIGIAKSYNKLLELAHGRYIALMNHDDEMMACRLEKQVDFLEKNPVVGLVGCGYKKFGEINRFKNIYGPQKHEEIMAMFLFKSPIHHPTIMMRSDIVRKHNICYDEEFISLNDRKFCWDFGKHAELCNIGEVLYKYRFHPNMTSKKEKHNIRKEKEKFHKLWLEYYGIGLRDNEIDILDNYITVGRAKINDKETIKNVFCVLENLVNINKSKKLIKGEIFAEVCAKYARKRCMNAILVGFINVKDIIESSFLPIKNKSQILLCNSVFGWRK